MSRNFVWGPRAGIIFLGFRYKVRLRDQTSPVFGPQQGSTSELLGAKSGPKIDNNSGSKTRRSKVDSIHCPKCSELLWVEPFWSPGVPGEKPNTSPLILSQRRWAKAWRIQTLRALRRTILVALCISVIVARYVLLTLLGALTLI